MMVNPQHRVQFVDLGPVMDPWMTWAVIVLGASVLIILAFVIDGYFWRKRAEREYIDELRFRRASAAMAGRPDRVGHPSRTPR